LVRGGTVEKKHLQILAVSSTGDPARSLVYSRGTYPRSAMRVACLKFCSALRTVKLKAPLQVGDCLIVLETRIGRAQRKVRRPQVFGIAIKTRAMASEQEVSCCQKSGFIALAICGCVRSLARRSHRFRQRR
jgi:hypothetical protein